jgi:hypothetical protein
LPGQRLSACTCQGESHPGPVRSNGNYVGRSAPEIDVFEATIDGGMGKVRSNEFLSLFDVLISYRTLGIAIGTVGTFQRTSRLR